MSKYQPLNGLILVSESKANEEVKTTAGLYLPTERKPIRRAVVIGKGGNVEHITPELTIGDVVLFEDSAPHCVIDQDDETRLVAIECTRLLCVEKQDNHRYDY